MELTNTFRVAAPVDRAWAMITDLERVAPCLPGAALLGVDGGDYRGAVKVKVGPVTAQYEGIARFTECDDEKHHAVLRAEGRDVRSQGNAAATIDLRLTPRGGGTEVVVVADLELAGRVAQFGRGVIADVSGKLIGQFAQRLEEEMALEPMRTPEHVPEPGAIRRPAPGIRPAEDVEPLDLTAAGGGALLALVRQQAVPLGAAAAGMLLGWFVGRSGGRTGRRSGATTPPVPISPVRTSPVRSAPAPLPLVLRLVLLDGGS
jgi:hypothetical protein